MHKQMNNYNTYTTTIYYKYYSSHYYYKNILQLLQILQIPIVQQLLQLLLPSVNHVTDCCGSKKKQKYDHNLRQSRSRASVSDSWPICCHSKFLHKLFPRVPLSASGGI